MIYIRLAGGLGNQLFQLAAALEVQKKMNLPISFFTGHLKNYETPRSFMLEKLIKNKIEYKLKHPNFFVEQILKYRINKLLPSIFTWSITNKNIQSFRTNRFYVLDDYFQDINYIQNGINIVCDLINLSIQHNQLVNNLNKNFTNKSIAVHVRRGDFLNKTNVSVYAVPNNNYYIEGLKRFDNVDKICLFSENLIDDLFQDSPIVITHSTNLKINDVDEFLLMASFNNFIIANSTFSFWASLAAKKRNKMVKIIFPSKWLQNEDDDTVWSKNTSFLK